MNRPERIRRALIRRIAHWCDTQELAWRKREWEASPITPRGEPGRKASCDGGCSGCGYMCTGCGRAS